MLSSAQLALLKAELDTTYVGKTNGTVTVEINDPDGPNSIADFDVARVPAEDVVAAVILSEYQALSASGQRAWLMVAGLDSVPVGHAGIKSLVQDIWGVPTTTRTNLVTLQTRRGSHAEALFGVPATIDDIRAARLV